MSDVPHVTWVVGRKRALANAVAVALLEMQGKDPRRVGDARFQQLADEAERHVDEMVKRGVLASFEQPFAGTGVEPFGP